MRIMPAPEKPSYGFPCNGCGLCCAVELCTAAALVGEVKTPCKYMVYKKERIWCGMVLVEKSNGLPPLVEKALGIGLGCFVEDDEN